MAKACVYLCYQCFATLVVFGGLGEFVGFTKYRNSLLSRLCKYIALNILRLEPRDEFVVISSRCLYAVFG